MWFIPMKDALTTPICRKSGSHRSVTAPDDSTVEIHLKYQFSPLMEKIASIGIINEKFAEENKDTQGLLALTPAVPEPIPWQRLSLM